MFVVPMVNHQPRVTFVFGNWVQGPGESFSALPRREKRKVGVCVAHPLSVGGDEALLVAVWFGVGRNKLL